eukprot:CAMPEP_0168517496 /NCGR_PEP_ID=MMETSP0405-20121227/6079_1 /TAXON_ID=498012 /ORGANISM="Trichosphaerium sp, Strain Am-I-7 wt" /LENGTH=102 /DNA_ID=CAMNT_0008537503 /DNA_START=358 /DNA_END=667 /DNA_ORIENTATION=-
MGPIFEDADGLIYVVDSNDRTRTEEARQELTNLLQDNDLKDVAVLVFANKQDLPNAMSVAEVADKLNLSGLRQKKWHIQGCCATEGKGLYEGLDWLSNTLKG